MRLLAKSKSVLGLPRKRVTRPLRKGEKPMVDDIVPFEKLTATAQVTPELLNSVYKEIDGPALPRSAFLFRQDRLQPPVMLHLDNPKAELKRLREQQDVVLRIDQVNDVLEAMVKKDPDAALKVIPKLESEFGVRPDGRTEAIVAELAIMKAKPQEALVLLDKREGLLSAKEEFLFGELVVSLLKGGNVEDGVRLYERYVQKVASPSPFVVSACIVALAKDSLVERAFLVFREARERKQMSLNVVCHSALLFAAAKRKEYYREAVDAFRQMLDLNMAVDSFDYANLMMAAGKVGDMETALLIWQRCCELNEMHNQHLIANLFYALASTEGQQSKLSLRAYCSALTDQEIVAAAKEVYDGLPDNVRTERVRAAFLACLCTHSDTETATQLFFDPKGRLNQHIPSVENFMRLCDTIHNVELLERAIAHCATTKMSRMTFRAIVRTFAYCHKYEEALQWIERMKTNGHIADRKSLNIVEKRLTQLELFNLRDRFLALTDPANDKQPTQRPPWRERSIRLAANLKTAYGPNAPKLATTH